MGRGRPRHAGTGPRQAWRCACEAAGATLARIAVAAAGCAVAWALALPARADGSSSTSLSHPEQPLASRLSAVETAGEYWDVAAWFDSGDRFFARFLVTNQGPGVRNAAVIGHFLGAGGAVVPFKWGRRDGAWTLAPDGRRVTIGKATLDVSGPTITVRIDSKKHGIDLGLAIDSGNGVEGFRIRQPADTFAVAMPAAARGAMNADDPSKARTLVGSAAVVHRWSNRPESESVRRRDEVFARRGGVALYVVATTSSDGTRRTTFDLRHGGEDTSSTSAEPLTYERELLPGSDGGYPVARVWHVPFVNAADVRTTLDGPLLRINPLDVLPQPFRFLLGLGGTPHRVWSNATVRLPLDGGEVVDLDGIAVSSFARPER